MKQEMNNTRVKGFLSASGKTVVNGDGEEIILTGWGLGNWLLSEGYMWMSHNEAFDRPRRMEAVVRELTGSTYAEYFWKKFRENYVTKEDIRLMAEQGYNSVRIPINWTILMENEQGIHWKEDGFQLIDQCLDWCEEYNLYAFLDLHGAPGGQTGANIDDSVDDIPRLFIDEDSWQKGIAIWGKLAERYKDRWIVGGYDLLNEPIRPSAGGSVNYDYLLPKLAQFYDEAIAVIRAVDDRHMISIEGHHWATSTKVFHKKYDENMIIHFHRYGCTPDMSAFTEWLELSERWNAPLWLGETGENINEWYTAIYPLSVALGIGYNLWPWKKMNCTNSPYSIELPEGWEEIIEYTNGGVRPSYERARAIFDAYLENMKVENSTYNAEVRNAVFRIPNCSVRATDFDELPGKGIGYSGIREESNLYGYRNETGMSIIEEEPIETLKQRFAFDCMWDRFVLELQVGEFVTYSINDTTINHHVSFVYRCDEPVTIKVLQNEKELITLPLNPTEKLKTTDEISLLTASEAAIRVEVIKGHLYLEKIMFN